MFHQVMIMWSVPGNLWDVFPDKHYGSTAPVNKYAHMGDIDQNQDTTKQNHWVSA